MKNEKSVEKIGYYLKYILGILFLAFVGSLISSALFETLGYEESSFYVLLGIWLVLLYLFLLNTPIEYPQHKETVWETRARYIGEHCFAVLGYFLFALFSLTNLGVLLELTLEIDISKFDTSRLLFLAWAGWIAGGYLFQIPKRKKMQEQLNRLGRGETIHLPPLRPLERYQQKQEKMSHLETEEIQAKGEGFEREAKVASDPFYGYTKPSSVKGVKDLYLTEEEKLQQEKEAEFEVQVRLPRETYEPQQKKPRKLAFMISTEHTAEEALEAFHKFQQTGKPVISLKKNNQPSQNYKK